MVVLTVKAGRKKIAITIIIIIAVIAGLFGIRALSGYIREGKKQQEPILGETKTQRVAFAESFGWELDQDGETMEPIMIPAQFGTEYTAYNELQKRAGFDLTAYKGEQVQEYSYPLLNAPFLGEGVCVRILVLQGQIVGADICAMQDGGTVYSIAEEFGQGQHSVSSEGEEGYASKQENSASETVASSEVDEAESVEPTAETILPALDDGAWPVD